MSEDLITIPRKRLEDLEARVAALEEALTPAQDGDAAAEGFAFYRGRARERERKD